MLQIAGYYCIMFKHMAHVIIVFYSLSPGQC